MTKISIRKVGNMLSLSVLKVSIVDWFFTQWRFWLGLWIAIPNKLIR